MQDLQSNPVVSNPNNCITLPQFPQMQILVKHSAWSGKLTLSVNGVPLQMAPNTKPRDKKFALPCPDGTVRTLQVKMGFTGGFTASVDGEVIQASRPLKWYEWVLSILPIVLIFSGGAVGGALGAGVMMLNFRIFRSEMPLPLKILLAFVSGGAAFVIFTIIATVLYMATH